MTSQREKDMDSFTTALLSVDAKRRGIMIRLPKPPPPKRLLLPTLEEFICSEPGVPTRRKAPPQSTAAGNCDSPISNERQPHTKKHRGASEAGSPGVSPAKAGNGKSVKRRAVNALKNALRWFKLKMTFD
ncbi:hypothetical protein CC1G_01013 [Coprinopsis cinerea okayama7|uniref:Uncharacterized protein n=1 Tax=Coprinopsis cinerea (strain Okayama-7 / 130 / ATCC MYA-4618 / FGSC 9003) TaxID=240176 RepID=A8NE74_COPC7|nr:hypothetical protein CC1G_01013 [Coprinopsis cinerea okayama7\|eukprot:XP_001832951.2 hypothetical protein CC1G_01013 [Coprinopsis cinerea okayama7\